jgi:3-deoxy-7-phosphoheptulonate synthase
MGNKINLNVTSTRQLASPFELKRQLPSTPKQRNFIEKTRKQIVDVLEHLDPRYILIVGPCSIHDIQAAKEYARKLRTLAKEVEDIFIVVMRVYFEKPRTASGWTGLLNDPHLDGSHAISTGLTMTRELLLNLADEEVPAAAEFLNPVAGNYFGDLISWGCVGARTAESQTHRQAASGFTMPIAFKNSTSGSIEIAVNGIVCASQPHKFIGIDEMGRVSVVDTFGNPHCHVALRGGENLPNYDPRSISRTVEALQKKGLPLRLIIDCSHDNSNRLHQHQPVVFQSIVHQILEGEKSIKGMILESNLEEGNQPMATDPCKLRPDVSITDPCLDWMTTERLVRWGYENLSSAKNKCLISACLKDG